MRRRNLEDAADVEQDGGDDEGLLATKILHQRVAAESAEEGASLEDGDDVGIRGRVVAEVEVALESR